MNVREKDKLYIIMFDYFLKGETTKLVNYNKLKNLIVNIYETIKNYYDFSKIETFEDIYNIVKKNDRWKDEEDEIYKNWDTQYLDRLIEVKKDSNEYYLTLEDITKFNNFEEVKKLSLGKYNKDKKFVVKIDYLYSYRKNRESDLPTFVNIKKNIVCYDGECEMCKLIKNYSIEGGIPIYLPKWKNYKHKLQIWWYDHEGNLFMNDELVVSKTQKELFLKGIIGWKWICKHGCTKRN